MPQKPKPSPERELRARVHNPEDPFGVSYKVYQNGRVKGAILPIEPDEDGARWEALSLKGESTRWKYRNQARDYLCDGPSRSGE